MGHLKNSNVQDNGATKDESIQTGEDLKGNLVQEYMQGSVRIRIWDGAYANRTPEEINLSLKRLENILYRIASAKVVADQNFE